MRYEKREWPWPKNKKDRIKTQILSKCTKPGILNVWCARFLRLSTISVIVSWIFRCQVEHHIKSYLMEHLRKGWEPVHCTLPWLVELVGKGTPHTPTRLLWKCISFFLMLSKIFNCIKTYWGSLMSTTNFGNRIKLIKNVFNRNNKNKRKW